MDNVFRGNTAVRWHEDMGAYGDMPRLALLNHIMIHVLNRIAETPVDMRTTGPKNYLHEALAELNHPHKLADLQSGDMLHGWHANTLDIQATYPGLEGARLWDIGCGNGYLGAWLGGLGVGYLGVEPSAELISICKSDGRLAGASLTDLSMAEFCQQSLADHDHEPTMISIVAVLEHIHDPQESLHALAKLLYDRGWHDVPILVATLDPDFLLPGLPVGAKTSPEAMAYGDPGKICLRDPAHWEELFAQTGFWVLEQRPVHLGRLPNWLADQFSDHFDALHAGAKATVPPRQGPFYFWLLCRARGQVVVDDLVSPAVSHIGDIGTTILRYAAGETIIPMGNLGATTGLVTKGRAHYSSETLRLNMNFEPNEFFGQLELSGNYVASRLLGVIRAAEETEVLSFASTGITGAVTTSRRLSDRLFQSLLAHLDSVRFATLVTPQRIGKDSSRVLGINVVKSWVTNYAGSLLQASSNAAAAIGHDGYRSRLVVEMGPDQLSAIVYGQEKRAMTALSIIPSFVQAEVIDCFSSTVLELKQLHESIEYVVDPDANILHVGWLAARFLAANDDTWFTESDEIIPSRAEAPGFDRMHELAIAISAMLGQDDDKDSVRDLMDRKVDVVRHYEKAGKKRRTARSSRLDPKVVRNFILDAMLPDTTGKTEAFLIELGRLFSFKPRDDYEKKSGLSDLVVVRDVWALLACIADDSSIWSHVDKQEKLRDYPGPRQRSRIIAYLQECVSHIGGKAGFTKSPW